MLSSLKGSLKAVAGFLGVLLTVLTFTHNIPFLPASLEAAVGVGIMVLTPIVAWFAPYKSTSAAKS